MVNILTSSQIPCKIREEVSGRVKPLPEVIGKGAVLADPVNRGAEYAVLQDEQPAQKQRKEKGKCYVSCVLFDDVQEVIYDRVPLNEVKKMTQKQYYARGCTALLDAMGGAIHHIGNVHKYSKEGIGKTLFIIITDGLENSSKRYTYVTIKQMVERQKEKYGWEFIFIGANMDVIQEANKFGIDQAVRYACDEEGTALNYSVLSENIIKMRTTVGNAKESLPADWAHKIKDDYQKRS